LHCPQAVPEPNSTKQLEIAGPEIEVVVVHAEEVARVGETLYPEGQAEQVPLPSGRHAAHRVTLAGELAVFTQRPQARVPPVPLAMYPGRQVRATVEVHVATPVPQAVQTPAALG